MLVIESALRARVDTREGKKSAAYDVPNTRRDTSAKPLPASRPITLTGSNNLRPVPGEDWKIILASKNTTAELTTIENSNLPISGIHNMDIGSSSGASSGYVSLIELKGRNDK